MQYAKQKAFLTQSQKRIKSDIINIIGCSLINEVVQPVGEHQCANITPCNNGVVCRVVIREIIKGNLDVKASVKVAEVLSCKGSCIVLGVACCVEVSALKVSHKVNACLLGICKHLQVLAKGNILKSYLCVA